MDKTISINLTRAELVSVLGAALAVVAAVWHLGAYVHGVMSNANDLGQRVAKLEQATAEVQAECACVAPVSYIVAPSDPVEFSMTLATIEPQTVQIEVSTSTVLDPVDPRLMPSDGGTAMAHTVNANGTALSSDAVDVLSPY